MRSHCMVLFLCTEATQSARGGDTLRAAFYPEDYVLRGLISQRLLYQSSNLYAKAGKAVGWCARTVLPMGLAAYRRWAGSAQ